MNAEWESIRALRSEKTELETLVGRLKGESETLTKSINALKEQNLRYDTIAKETNVNIKNLNSIKNNLITDISEKEKSLSELVTKLRLFPTEISGFVREGNRSTIWYVFIGAPFALILAVILVKLFSNAVDLTQLYKKDEDIDVWTIFLTRIPFVIVAATLIEVCGVIVGRLVFEIIRINRQRLEFAKLSIIAKDVSTAASVGLEELSDVETYERETRLKMDLLREHMKNYVGSEFEYKGTGLISTIKGVAERLTVKKE